MTLRLTYFPIAGRAEPIRIAAFLGGVPLEDVRVAGPTFMELKRSGALPLGSMPVLELGDGTTVTQCVAMLRYVAALGSASWLYPTDPLKALVVDSVLDTFNVTLSDAFVASLREQDPVAKRALREAWVDGPMVRCFAYVERLAETYGGDGPFLLGSEMSIADLYLATNLKHYTSGNVDFIDASILDAYPRLKALRDAFSAHPQVVAYYAQAAR